jgi:hypothetical protein
MPDRKFPPPWTIEDNGACFMVRDANGQALAYTYYEEEPGRRTAASLLTRDQADRGQYRRAAGVAGTAGSLAAHHQNGFQLGFAVNLR